MCSAAPSSTSAWVRRRRLGAPLLALLIALSGLGLASSSLDPEGRPKPARYLRIELAGAPRILQLAEVWVLSAGQNVAASGSATQSSTHGGAAASRAIDGRTSGDYTAGSVSHTNEEAGPWWELDLGREVVVDQISVFNRTDCCGERLEGFTIQLLSENRTVVWNERGVAAPNPRYDVSLSGGAIVDLGPSRAERNQMQPRIDAAIDKGLEYLRRTQLRDGSWSQHQGTHFSGQAALSLLTMVKGGLALDDPAVIAARSFLRENSPDGTYGRGCLLMALEAIGDERDLEWAERVAEELIESQGGRDAAGEHPGIWSYPYRPNTVTCLSNTQYAILGLRSAQRMGVRISDRVFRRTADDLVEFRGPLERVKGVGRDPRGMEVGGFMYRAEGGHGGTSGSMTTAALAIMHIILDSFDGDPPRRLEQEFEEYSTSAWMWLERNFSVTENPGRGGSWHYYYLYGLERVGAFFDRSHVGSHDWYWEGAQYLVGKQKGDGGWGDETNTCFAILFLKRATASKSGPREKSSDADVYIAEGADAAVKWRGHGRRKGTFWISGFGDESVKSLGGEAGLRVAEVSYLVDGKVVDTQKGDPSRAWKATDRFPIQLQLADYGEGDRVVGVEVKLVDPKASVESGGYVTLKGPDLRVAALPAARTIDASFARHTQANLIRSSGVAAAEATSVNNDGQSANKAIDGMHGSYWLSKKEDKEPVLTIELRRPVRAERLLLSHANVDQRYLGAHDRASVVEVRINREKDWLRFELDLDDLGKSELELPKSKRIRRLEIKVLERVKGNRWPGHVGFAEVELLGRERR